MPSNLLPDRQPEGHARTLPAAQPAAAVMQQALDRRDQDACCPKRSLPQKLDRWLCVRRRLNGRARLMPNSLHNLFGLKPSIRDDKDSVVATGADQSSADICNEIKLPDTGGKPYQRSIRFAAREKVLDCCSYLRLQRVQACSVGRRWVVRSTGRSGCRPIVGQYHTRSGIQVGRFGTVDTGMPSCRPGCRP